MSQARQIRLAKAYRIQCECSDVEKRSASLMNDVRCFLEQFDRQTDDVLEETLADLRKELAEWCDWVLSHADEVSAAALKAVRQYDSSQVPMQGIGKHVDESKPVRADRLETADPSLEYDDDDPHFYEREETS